MTATAATSRTAPASSLASSRKFGTFAISFSLCGPAVYCLAQFLNWPLFTYWPATGRLVWGYEGGLSGQGPNMLWYGWTVTTILVAASLGLLAVMLPERITRKIPLALIWILPLLTVPYIIYSLMPWWILAAK